MDDAQDAFDAGQPFTRAAALAAGLTPAALRGPRFRRLGHGAYVDAAVATTPLAAARAVLLGYGGRAHASHATAARIHDLPIPVVLAEEHVTVATAAQRKWRSGACVHVARNAEIVKVDGDPVSSGRQTFLDLADTLGLVDLVVVGDALVRAGLTTPDGLVAFCAASSRRAASAAGRAAELVRARVDSPMETRLRLLLVFSGLPEPEVNRTLRADNGDPLRRYDLSWPSVKVVVEYDGRQHVERIEQWESDLDRREAIDDDGWRILVITSRGIYVNRPGPWSACGECCGRGASPDSRRAPPIPGERISLATADRTRAGARKVAVDLPYCQQLPAQMPGKPLPAGLCARIHNLSCESGPFTARRSPSRRGPRPAAARARSVRRRRRSTRPRRR